MRTLDTIQLNRQKLNFQSYRVNNYKAYDVNIMYV